MNAFKLPEDLLDLHPIDQVAESREYSGRELCLRK